MALNRSQLGKSRSEPTSFGRYWRAQQRPEVLASTIYMRRFDGAEHAHPEAQIAILLSGSSATFSRQGVSGSIHSAIAPGSYTYIHPEEMHRTRWNDWTEILNLYWEADTLRGLADQSGASLNEEPASYRTDPAIHSIGRILMDDFLQTGTLTEMMIDHGRALIASRLFRLSEQGSRRMQTGLLPRTRLEAAMDALIANPEKAFTLVELARLCHSSVFHFARSFTFRNGCAPFAFQRNLRMQKARELLLSSELSIEAVGQAVGIDSPTTFSRIFHQFNGQSPREYRQANSERDGD